MTAKTAKPSVEMTREVKFKGEKAGLPPDTESASEPGVKVRGTGAQVDVEVGGTIPVGDYASVRYSVRVSLPCAPSELEDAYAEAHAFAESKYKVQAQGVQEHVQKAREAAMAKAARKGPFGR